MNAVVFRISTQPGHLVGAALFRVLLGIAGIHFYLSSYRERNLLWGPHGYYDFPQFAHDIAKTSLVSVYTASSSPLFFQVVFHLGLVIAVAFTLRGGRILTVLHALFLWSLYNRNHLVLDGGDNFAQITVIFLCFTINDAYLSPASERRRRKRGEVKSQARASTLVHNTAIALIVFQVLVVYTIAGLWKVSGEHWRDGTAMYYVARSQEFGVTSAMRRLTANPVIVTGLTYTAIISQLQMLPAFVFTRRYRTVAVALVVLMHLGIITTMGLVGFGLTMIGGDLCCLDDSEFHRIRRLVFRGHGRVSLRLRRRDARTNEDDSRSTGLGAPSTV